MGWRNGKIKVGKKRYMYRYFFYILWIVCIHRLSLLSARISMEKEANDNEGLQVSIITIMYSERVVELFLLKSIFKKKTLHTLIELISRLLSNE